jgi:hypothetical protein
MQEHSTERLDSAAVAVSAAFVAHLLQPCDMTETATTLTGPNCWTLQPKSGAPRSDRTDFQC